MVAGYGRERLRERAMALYLVVGMLIEYPMRNSKVLFLKATKFYTPVIERTAATQTICMLELTLTT